MLTKLTVRNFKRFGEVEIELGNPVVFIGPNDSGKTTALQALALWDVGLRRWNEKRGGKSKPEKRPGVAINRRDLIAVPVPNAILLWRNLAVRSVERNAGRQRTRNIRMDIVVEGQTKGRHWECGLEFDYANEESMYCRPLRRSEEKNPTRMHIPEEAGKVRIAFLPPMSGLAASETHLDPGAISVRLGEGRTAEVLRNLCYGVLPESGGGSEEKWKGLCEAIRHLFGVTLDRPEHVPERGEITMTYRDPSGSRLDLSCSGRGMQQTLLLLAYLAANPNSVLLLDEPDAHLEILRQRQIYQMLTEAAVEQDSQVIAASHSEVVLNEAARRDVVVAFLGKPHRIDDRGTQVLKALKDIGFDQYYQAEQTGWVLYLEGPNGLAILRSFAKALGHGAQGLLERPFVHYVLNSPAKAYDHYYGLREAKKDLLGYAIFDRLERELEEKPGLLQHMWARREIENYLCTKEALLRWAEEKGRWEQGAVFAMSWKQDMERCMDEIERAMKELRKGSPWSADTKVSDELLGPLFDKFFETKGLPNFMQKSGYHELARHTEAHMIDPEVREVLDGICEIAQKANQAQVVL